MPIVDLTNVSFSYDKHRNVIDDLSFSIERGSYLAVIGHNGSGKSTLAKLLNGLLTPTSGSILIDGKSSRDSKSLFDIRKQVGVVFQNPDNGIIASIVEDDIAFGPENLGINREEIAKRIDNALKAVGMEKYKTSSPMRLSGGQKQRIAIAGVLALNPDILVLDESTAMLDPKGRKEILEIVKKLNKEKHITVIAITHYMDEVLSADKVIVLNEGKIALSGTPKEIFSRGKEIKNYGIELPMPSYIAQKLKEEGIAVEGEILTSDDLVNAICKLK